MITDNYLSGAFSYGIAISSARNFTIQNNILIGNTSFIGANEPNCSKTDPPPTFAPFVVDRNSTQGLTLQADFQTVTKADSLVCVSPPGAGKYWPFGTNPSNITSPGSPKLTAADNAGIAIGVILGIIALGIALWFVHKRSVRKHRARVALGLGLGRFSMTKLQ